MTRHKDQQKDVTWQDVKTAEKGLLKDSDSTIGLALSGGGIRSATFCLGVLQYLAERRWLRKIDYLSTVSGGGYIGAWLTALIFRTHEETVRSESNDPRTETWDKIEDNDEEHYVGLVNDPQSKEVQWIRNHSNFLTPLKGLSGDTVATIGLILTNLFLTIIITGAIVGAIALFLLWVGSLLTLIATATRPVPQLYDILTYPFFVQIICAFPVLAGLGITLWVLKQKQGHPANRYSPTERSLIVSIFGTMACLYIFVSVFVVQTTGFRSESILLLLFSFIALLLWLAFLRGPEVPSPEQQFKWVADHLVINIVIGAFFLFFLWAHLDGGREWPSGFILPHLIWISSGLLSFLGAFLLFVPARNIMDEFRHKDSEKSTASNEAADGENASESTGCADTHIPSYCTPCIVVSALFFTFALFAFALLMSYAISKDEAPRILTITWFQNVSWFKDFNSTQKDYLYGVLMFSLFYFFGGLPIHVLFWGELAERKGFFRSFNATWRAILSFWFPLTTLIAGIAGGFMLAFLSDIAIGDTEAVSYHEWSAWPRVIFGVSAAMFGLLFTLGVQMMLVRRSVPPVLREWWHRVVGYLLRTVVVWILLSGALIVGAALLKWGPWMDFVVGGAWLSSTVAGMLLAIGRYVGKVDEKASVRALNLMVPWVFVAGLVLFGFGFTLRLVVPEVVGVSCEGLGNCLTELAGALEKKAQPLHIFLWLLGFLVFIGIVGVSYNVNWHSLYHLYRSRLARCFLGASNPEHKENAARFAPHDDVRLAKINHRPIHIFCTTLNLVGSSNLAWQTRKGASFFFGPEYCGYVLPKAKCGTRDFSDVQEFVRTKEYMTPLDAEENEEPWLSHATLGTAMTISGAAMTPSCGYHSNPAFAFLMGMFNVRLGRWCPNPSRQRFLWLDNHRRADPWFGILWFIREWLGFTTEKSSFVYLSDGGHFDNTGIYELVRRRCKYIIAVDGEYDPESNFEGLTEAARKCYLDLHAKIEIDPASIKKEDDGYWSKSYAIGKITYYEHPVFQPEKNYTIAKNKVLDASVEANGRVSSSGKLSYALESDVSHGKLVLNRDGSFRYAPEANYTGCDGFSYMVTDAASGESRSRSVRLSIDPVGDKEECIKHGKLLYIKLSLPSPKDNKIPIDVLGYHSAHKKFPHDPTSDQWFDENQFESYRKLGKTIARATFESVEDKLDIKEAIKLLFDDASRPKASCPEWRL